MFKYSSAKYKNKNKKRLQKSLVEGIKIFLKKRKTKSYNVVANDMQIPRKKTEASRV